MGAGNVEIRSRHVHMRPGHPQVGVELHTAPPCPLGGVQGLTPDPAEHHGAEPLRREATDSAPRPR